MNQNQYNFNIDPQGLPEEQINQHKDFDEVLRRFEATQAASATAEPTSPKSTGRLFYLRLLTGLIAASILGFVLYQALYQAPVQTDWEATQAYLDAKPYIDRPMKQVPEFFHKGNVLAQNGGTVQFGDGSKVNVPAQAFVNAQGQPIDGEVEIVVKEMHDFVDFFLSGIPMEYDSAGTRYYLESAGMIEIFAQQGENRVQLAPDKEIDVELVSNINIPATGGAPNFNIYYLDTVKRNWVYQGVNDMEVLHQNEDDLKVLLSEEEQEIRRKHDTEIAKLERKEAEQLAAIEATIPKPKAPTKPSPADPNNYVFNLDIQADQVNFMNNTPGDAQRDLETAMSDLTTLKQKYGKVLWEVIPDRNPTFNQQAAAQINWEDFKISPVDKQNFELTLINEEMEMNVLVKPVLTGVDYQTALSEFNEAYQAYQTQLDDRETQLAEAKANLSEQINQERMDFKQDFEERIAAYRAQGKDHRATEEMVKAKVLSRFSVTRFGIWNCDRPTPPFVQKVDGDFQSKDQQDLHKNMAFLVDKKRNTVARFFTGKGSRVEFNNDSENLMWLVTPDNKIAIFPPEEFAQIEKNQSEVTFVMDVLDRDIQSEEDLRAILRF